MYYNYSNILSYKRPISFVIGTRGVGKSYGAKEQVIRNFIYNNKQSVWIRRLEVELILTEKTFLSDIGEKFPEHNFKVSGDCLYFVEDVNGVVVNTPICYFICLSKYETYKGSTYNNVSLIVFDECLTARRYLTDEIFKFCDLLTTIIRDRECRILMLSNALSICNPYFEFLGVRWKDNQRFIVNKKCVIENCDCGEFKEHMKKSMLGQLLEDTTYGDYAIDNRFLLDDNTNVEKDYKNNNQIIFNLILNKVKIGVYFCNGIYYFSDYYNFAKDYTIYLEDCIDTSVRLVDKNASVCRTISSMLLRNQCKYKNIKFKNEIMLMARKIIKNY